MKTLAALVSGVGWIKGVLAVAFGFIAMLSGDASLGRESSLWLTDGMVMVLWAEYMTRGPTSTLA